ncbi:hypothetical protein PTKIN_Ptkin09bG0125900 [Pterospermum kingtungense]
MNEAASRVRNVVRYIRSSPARLSKFKECIKAKNVDYKGLMCLDVSTRWNSIFIRKKLSYVEFCMLEMYGKEKSDLLYRNVKYALNELFAKHSAMVQPITIGKSTSSSEVGAKQKVVSDEASGVGNSKDWLRSGSGSTMRMDDVKDNLEELEKVDFDCFGDNFGLGIHKNLVGWLYEGFTDLVIYVWFWKTSPSEDFKLLFFFAEAFNYLLAAALGFACLKRTFVNGF